MINKWSVHAVDNNKVIDEVMAILKERGPNLDSLPTTLPSEGEAFGHIPDGGINWRAYDSLPTLQDLPAEVMGPLSSFHD